MDLNNPLYSIESNIFSNFDKLSCEYRCLKHMFKEYFTANARSYKVAENAFLYRRHLFLKFVFCSYKSEINATLYNAIS